MPEHRHRKRIPVGHREIRVKRVHQGEEHGDYLGHHRPTERFILVRSRSDGEHHALDKADLLPPGLWRLYEAISAAAAVEECSESAIIGFLGERLGNPKDPLLELLKDIRITDSSHHSGHLRPVQKTEAPDGPPCSAA